jgi:phospholipase C
LRILTEKIRHVVVLMLENRSFDNMLGVLYSPEAIMHYFRPEQLPALIQ